MVVSFLIACASLVSCIANFLFDKCPWSITTVATAKGGQRGHSWLEQYLIESSDENGKIEAVFVDCQHDSGVNAVGALRLGSHQTKFSMEQWADAYDSSKKHQILSKAKFLPDALPDAT